MAEAQEETLLSRVHRLEQELEHLKRALLQQLTASPRAQTAGKPSLLGCVRSKGLFVLPFSLQPMAYSLTQSSLLVTQHSFQPRLAQAVKKALDVRWIFYAARCFLMSNPFQNPNVSLRIARSFGSERLSSRSNAFMPESFSTS